MTSPPRYVFSTRMARTCERVSDRIWSAGSYNDRVQLDKAYRLRKAREVDDTFVQSVDPFRREGRS